MGKRQVLPIWTVVTLSRKLGNAPVRLLMIDKLLSSSHSLAHAGWLSGLNVCTALCAVHWSECIYLWVCFWYVKEWERHIKVSKLRCTSREEKTGWAILLSWHTNINTHCMYNKKPTLRRNQTTSWVMLNTQALCSKNNKHLQNTVNSKVNLFTFS